MITIYFTQCCRERFRVNQTCRHAETMPIIPRCLFYEGVLKEAERYGDTNFFTHDENLILIAQCFRRKGIIKKLTLVSVCDCNNNYEELAAVVDDEGDFPEDCDPHHGFFGQRLKYLR